MFHHHLLEKIFGSLFPSIEESQIQALLFLNFGANSVFVVVVLDRVMISKEMIQN